MVNDNEILDILQEAICPNCGDKHRIERRVMSDNPQIFSFVSLDPKPAGCSDFDRELNEKFYSVRAGHLTLLELRAWVQGT